MAENTPNESPRREEPRDGKNNNNNNNNRKRRRNGAPRRDENRPQPEAKDTSGPQAPAKEQPARPQGQQRGRSNNRGRRGNRQQAPARILSPNVITTDADEVKAPAYIPPAVEDRTKYLEIPDHWFEPEAPSLPAEPQQMVDIVGVRFRDSGKVYYFAPMDYVCCEGQDVIVETARGIEYGTVTIPNRQEPESSLVAPLRPVVRIATDADRERHEKNTEREAEAMRICAKKIEDHGLEMKLVEAEYTFDNSKLTFYFSAEGRVDFRELVKDLAYVFRTRIELRQIGIRDEAKLLGGLGICGRPFCCSTFLYDFNQVSIKMAKEQSLSLNSSKISGTCGRLMCCLRYESEAYEEEGKRTPRVDSIVKTKDGTGFVIESQTLTGIIKVKLGDADDAAIKQYSRDEVTVIGRRGGRGGGDRGEARDADLAGVTE